MVYLSDHTTLDFGIILNEKGTFTHIINRFLPFFIETVYPYVWPLPNCSKNVLRLK
jgi:hypothetical protein